MKWEIEFHPFDGTDEDSEEYWTVTDGDLVFRSFDKDAAEWLVEILNSTVNTLTP